ncbi:MAG: hypothetical protein ACLTFW_26430, partial [Klebsiella pneumoniae]
MALYKTGNPVPSSAMPDVWDNNATIDEFVNSDDLSVTTRVGIVRDTMSGMQKKSDDQRILASVALTEQMNSQQSAFNADQQDRANQFEQAISLIGWQELGDWSVGITVDNRNQIIWYGNSWYRYIGTLPHVTSGAGPDEDGGIYSEETKSGQWVNIGAASTTEAMGFVTAGMLGIFPSATLIQTEKLTQLFATDGLLAITEPGIYLTNATLSLRDNATLYLASGVTLKQADGANKNVISNTLADAPE